MKNDLANSEYISLIKAGCRNNFFSEKNFSVFRRV